MAGIVDCIPLGESNAIPSKVLADLCGFNSVRDLQLAIEKLRNDGKVICSSTSGGYYIAANTSELRNYVRANENRARNTFRSLSGARRRLRELERENSNQTKIEELGE